MLLASAAFHALLGLLFVFDLARRPVAEAPRPMSVWLEPPAPASKPAPPSSRGDGTARAAVRTEAPPAAAALPALPGSPSPSSAPSASVAEAPAADLRGLGGGCRLSTLDRLPAEARERCQERLARAMGEVSAPRPNLDPTGRYARDARPYLTRPPENGCKAVGSVKPGLMGATDATLGLGCAKAF